MKRLHNMKIKHQIQILILFTIFILVLTQILYYIGYTNILQRRTYDYFRDTSTRTENQIESMLTDVESLAYIISCSYNVQNYLLSTHPAKKFQLMDSAIDNLNYTLASNNGIKSIRILGKDGQIIRSGVEDTFTIYHAIQQDYDLVHQTFASPFYTHPYELQQGQNRYFAYVYPIYSVIEGYAANENIGVCIIVYDMQLLTSCISEASYMNLIIGHGDEIIAANTPKYDDNAANIVRHIHQGNKDNIIKVQGVEYIIQSTVIKNTGWEIINFASVKDCIKDFVPIRNVGIIIFITTVIILTIVALIIMRSITEPISDIVTGMNTLGHGKRDTKDRLHIPANNEVGMLAMDINNMLDRLEHMTQRILNAQETIYESEIAKNQAELLFYQSQINPHFLYNTLECIRSMGLYYKSSEIVAISTSMGDMFRYCVQKQNKVSIQEELVCVQNYFNIMSIRYNNRFTLCIDVDEAILSTSIMRMILQPIVENAINHGLKAEKGRIRIKGKIQNEKDVLLVISDNGVGIAKERLIDLNDHIKRPHLFDINAGAIGLQNIHHRLRLTYGEPYGITIISKVDLGTVVKVLIPYT